MNVEQAATPPAAESGSGRMSLDDAVKSAVRSTAGIQKFEDAPTPPMEGETVDDSANQPVAPEDGAGNETQDAEPSAKSAKSKDVTRPVEGSQAVPEVKASLDAPKNWPKDRRDQFAALSDDAKRIILDRDKEYNTGFTKNAQDNADHRRRSESVVNAFQPHHRQEMQRSGLDEVGSVKYLLQQHDSFNRDPVEFVSRVAKQSGQPAEFVKALIRQTGLTLDQLTGQTPGQTPQPTGQTHDEWVDPHVVALQQQFGQLQQQHQQVQQELARRQQTEEQGRRAEANRQAQTLENQLHAFYTATDADGSPKYAHAQTVENQMAMIIQNDPSLQRMDIAQALETAYNQALYLNPEIRQQIETDQRAKWQADRDAETQAKNAAAAVAKAKAAGTIKGSPGANGSNVGNKRMSIDEAAKAGVRSAYRNR